MQSLGLFQKRIIAFSLSGIAYLWLLVFATAIITLASNVWAIGDKNTVALWHFDEKKGEVVADTSENHLEGIQVSCEWVDGKFNSSALQFNKAGSHVEIPYNDALALQVFTIEFWTKYIKPPAEHSSFMSNRGWIVGDKMTGWTIRDHDGNLYLEILTKGQFQTDGALLNSGDWLFLTITYDGSSAKLYINAELKKETQIPGKIIYAGESLWIGAEPSGGYAFGNSGDIIIDEVRISNIVRTENEIQAAMEEGYGDEAVEAVGKLPVQWGRIKYYPYTHQ